jgi:hypothetical protein
MYKCNEQRTIDRTIFYKEGRRYFISQQGSSGNMKWAGISSFTKKELEKLYQEIGRELGKSDFQADMKKARARNWN